MTALMDNQRFLESKGLECDIAKSQREAISLFGQNQYSCFLIERFLETRQSFFLSSWLRRFSKAPILFFGPPLSLEEKTSLLSYCDDYLPLHWQTDSSWNQIKKNIEMTMNAPAQYLCRSLSVDLIERSARINGAKVILTPLQFDILVFLIQKKDQVLSMDTIYRNVWSNEEADQLETVQVNISRLRRKLQEAEPRFDFILTIRGRGYCFHCE